MSQNEHIAPVTLEVQDLELGTTSVIIGGSNG